MRIAITGAAGFIGGAASLRLVRAGHTVLGIDNFFPNYDLNLKRQRLERIDSDAFSFRHCDITNATEFGKILEAFRPEAVVHLAAQVGVRKSEETPQLFVQTNVSGFLNVLEACRALQIPRLVYASSSSVYGDTGSASTESQIPDRPLSLYAATKRSNELMAHSYSHLFGLMTTGLRFFTVYGPWGRPDMAYYSFAMNIALEKPVTLFSEGHHGRDFTYIDDAVETIERDLARPLRAGTAEILNVGTGKTVSVPVVVSKLEENLQKRATVVLAPRRPSDVFETRADVTHITETLGWAPQTRFEDGISRFVQWFRTYHDVLPFPPLHSSWHFQGDVDTLDRCKF